MTQSRGKFQVDDYSIDRSQFETLSSEEIMSSRIEVSISPEGGLKIIKFSPKRVAVSAQRRINEQRMIKGQFRALADKLCEEHPAISTDKSIFGGMPHIKNVRLSVGDILAKLYVYGSVQAILDIYAPDIDEEQIKEAIAYAQDFLEIACDPDESSEIDD